MNRFRTRKKAKEAKEAKEAGRIEEQQSSMPSLFRRGKKSQEEEQKKEIDLTEALPSSDDFRTSLLMTGLSARFSMLREQDDPNTKIGKASDDSVLFPKRQSRLMDFSYGGGLADIAEVESIRAPPSFTRMDSYHDASDGADSVGGSIMDRAKPTEGNNLFGGRQKIYKIPVGATSSKNVNAGAMGGRALYEDDVAMSAFQKYRRQAERERNPSFEYDDKELLDGHQNSEQYSFQRSESPLPQGYNRKRETSSTTSSTPSITRNSTAATSVVSQPPTSLKDWQSQSTAPTSASSTPAIDRSFTRMRRLYEQGLNQELHEQQSSALSRIDTLSGKRTYGSRTPDLGQNTPSPTSFGFGDRFGAERRQILTKASAPNLRSISPPATASSVGTTDSGSKPLAIPELTGFAGTPPLSPPVSEGGSDHPLFAIQPNDRGKATALGVFQKPLQPYDESKYAQRQLQLQHDREGPIQRLRAESNASYATGRSRSSSTAPNQNDAAQTSARTTFYEEDETPEATDTQKPEIPSNLSLQRPSDEGHPALRQSDEEHPALRQSAMPTPLSISTKISDDPSPISERPNLSSNNSHQVSPEDSPTLGPGLSGMVRQHLRGDSNASSVYGNAPQTAGLESRFPPDTHDSKFMDTLEVKTLGNPWDEQDWNLSLYGIDDQGVQPPVAKTQEPVKRVPIESPTVRPQATPNRFSDELDSDGDDFANQLANARRRVQERLTTYVESDSSRGASPLLPPTEPAIPPPSRSNPLGILRGKSSRGSLMDRQRDPSQSKAMKMLGLSAQTMSTTPSPSKQVFEDAPLPAMDGEAQPSARESEEAPNNGAAADVPSSVSPEEPEENIHPGLRAFRQARRELQKRKELETLAKHQSPAPSSQHQGSAPSTQHSSESTPVKESYGGGHRTPSRDRKPPPVYYQKRAPSEESRSNGPDSRSASRPPSRSERDRSGSEASNGRSYSRPARLRSNSRPYEDGQGQLGPNGTPRQAMMRSPGLPGTDIRRSPLMPPQGHPGGQPSPGHFERSVSSGKLHPSSGRAGYDSPSGQASPLSPLSPLPPMSPFVAGLPHSPYMGPSPNGSVATTPTTASHRRPSAPPAPGFNTTSSLNESMKKVVNKNDISEPKFIMSTSRVPTVSLPQNTSPESQPGSASSSRNASRSRSGSVAAHAPPLPPINPMRNRDGSRTRPMMGGFMGRRDLDEGASASSPHLPLSGSAGGLSRADEGRGPFSISDDEDDRVGRFRAQRQNADSHAFNGRAMPPQREHRKSPPFVAAGPPASRSVVTSTMNYQSSVPGGMI